MRLAFWRTEKPVARPVLQPGADSPYVPRLGVWMERVSTFGPLPQCWGMGCQEKNALSYFVYAEDEFNSSHETWVRCEGCGAKLVAQLRREREG